MYNLFLFASASTLTGMYGVGRLIINRKIRNGIHHHSQFRVEPSVPKPRQRQEVYLHFFAVYITPSSFRGLDIQLTPNPTSWGPPQLNSQ